MELIGAKLRNIYDITKNNKTDKKQGEYLNIPFYQRPYSWTDENNWLLLELFNYYKNYSKNGVPTEEFFIKRKARLINCFYTTISMQCYEAQSKKITNLI